MNTYDIMTTIKTKLDDLNLMVVKGQIPVKNYEEFILNLNENMPPNYKIKKVNKK